MTKSVQVNIQPELPPVFHIFNRANDRQTLFKTDRNYCYFLSKAVLCLENAAHLLGYCLMPNHFHFLLTPKHPLVVPLPFNDKLMSRLPTDELSEAFKCMLMGFSKGYNGELGITGSRWQQRTRCKHHYRAFHYGLRYVHYNPVKAKLVEHPGEWGYSSYLEYEGHLLPDEGICNVSMGKKLLQAGILE